MRPRVGGAHWPVLLWCRSAASGFPLLTLFAGKCEMCQDTVCCLRPSDWDVAHNIARSKGGSMMLDNLRVTCWARCLMEIGNTEGSTRPAEIRSNSAAAALNLCSIIRQTEHARPAITFLQAAVAFHLLQKVVLVLRVICPVEFMCKTAIECSHRLLRCPTHLRGSFHQ